MEVPGNKKKQEKKSNDNTECCADIHNDKVGLYEA